MFSSVTNSTMANAIDFGKLEVHESDLHSTICICRFEVESALIRCSILPSSTCKESMYRPKEYYPYIKNVLKTRARREIPQEQKSI